MNEEQETRKECSIAATDAAGEPNLCCCYFIDEQGRYVDPCDQPVIDCC